MDVQQSGVKQHPFTFQQTGNECCLTPSIGEGVCQHKTAFNHNFLRDSTGYNDRSHAVPAPLGCLLKVIGAGTGVAHVEIENIVIGIFKYP